MVVGDSPQFSTPTARTAPPELVGSALAIVVNIGFAITIVSLQTTALLATWLAPGHLLSALALGPAIGLWQLRRLACSIAATAARHAQAAGRRRRQQDMSMIAEVQ